MQRQNIMVTGAPRSGTTFLGRSIDFPKIFFICGNHLMGL